MFLLDKTRAHIAFVIALANGLAWLAACTTTPSARLTEHVAPVEAALVVVFLGSFGGPGSPRASTREPGSAVSQAMQVRLPEILQRNGVVVSGYQQLIQPMRQLDELERLWAGQRQLHGTTSHVLVLTAQRMRTYGQAASIEYEAVLWDTAKRQLVWKAAPISPLNGQRPLLEAEMLAGDLLRALQRDAVVALPKGYPVGIDDHEIARQWN
ncbi:MAG: hypothetical protein JF606_26010 [Burkholderiales bacterium]|jgi:uncharacterized lipoprotein YmbA|nr:hypothetical protein [Burkholderiales bacterium]